MTDEREEAAKQIRRVRDTVADEPSEVRSAQQVLGEARTPRAPAAVPVLEIPAAPPVPAPPDGTDVNATWDIRRAVTSGGRLRRWLARLAAPLVETQTTFNARQVQFDNALMTFLVARLEAIHRQYDAVLGIHGRHMEDIDARHLILQEELVAHVHDLVRRIDLTLAEGERTRLSLESQVRELRARVRELEARLAGGER